MVTGRALGVTNSSRQVGPDASKTGQARRTKVTKHWTRAWNLLESWRSSASANVVAHMSRDGRPRLPENGGIAGVAYRSYRSGLASKKAVGFVGQRGCGRGLIYVRSLPSFTRSHHHTNRTDAAITYTTPILPSFVVVRKLSVASSSTTYISRPPLLPVIIAAFHSFLPQPPTHC
jgi:hypothetical protein